MKINSIIVILLFLCSTISANVNIDNDLKNAFILSIIHVESKGKDHLISKDGSAGPLQIKSILVKDVNRIILKKANEKRYTLNDRFNREKSIEMFWIYQSFYGNINDSFETMARRWNGGPNGHKKKKTLVYWKKVNKFLLTQIKTMNTNTNNS